MGRRTCCPGTAWNLYSGFKREKTESVPSQYVQKGIFAGLQSAMICGLVTAIIVGLDLMFFPDRIDGHMVLRYTSVIGAKRAR